MRSQLAQVEQCLVTQEALSIAVVGAPNHKILPLISSLEVRGCRVVQTTMKRYLSPVIPRPEIVLLDQQGSDRQLLANVIELRRSNMQRGIIVLGRSVDIGLQAQFLEMGTDDYFSLPMDISDALARINVLVRAMNLPELPRYHFSTQLRRG